MDNWKEMIFDVYGDDYPWVKAGLYILNTIVLIIAVPLTVGYVLGPYLWLAGTTYFGLQDDLIMVLLWNTVFVSLHLIINTDIDEKMNQLDDTIDETVNIIMAYPPIKQ